MAFSSLSHSYKSLQGSISSMYKGMSPFSSSKVEDTTPEQRSAKEQSENLKWQQEMFHKILNMVGLHKEGIVSEKEVGVVRTELLDDLIASPADGESPAITRDKLIFLQELLYAKCISDEDYHLSKRPLLLRLAVQGAEIDSRDVLLAGGPIPPAPNTLKNWPDALQALQEPLNKKETEWSVVEFKENQSMLKDLPSKDEGCHSKEKSPMKGLINAISRLSVTPHKGKQSKDKRPYQTLPRSIDLQSSEDCYPSRNPNALPMQLAIYINPTESFKENPFWQVAGLIDVPEQPERRTFEESSLLENHLASETGHKKGATKAKVKKALNQLFSKVHKEHSKEDQTEVSYSSCLSDFDSDSDTEEKPLKPVKKTWGLDLFKSPKKTDCEEENTFLPINCRSTEEAAPPSKLVNRPIGEAPNTKKIKKKMLSDGASSGFFIDKVLGQNIKTELSRIRAEMGTTNPSPKFTNEQIEAIATRLPVDKNELKKFFPKTWCDRYRDVVLDVVHKEFKHHVGEMENLSKTTQDRRSNAARRWGSEDNSLKYNKGKGGTPRKFSSDTMDRCFTTKDENSDPNISSSFTGQQPKSTLPFHPSAFTVSNQSSSLHKDKSPSPFSPSHNFDSPSSSPFYHKQSPKSPSSDQGKTQAKPPSPFLQATGFKSAGRKLSAEMELENRLTEQLEEEIQRMYQRSRTPDSKTHA